MTKAIRMHQLRTVRQQLGVSLLDVSQRLAMPVDRLICQETETNDLLLSELWQWHNVLGVPVGKLLIDQANALQSPTIERSQILQFLRFASLIRDRSREPNIRRLAKRLIAQLFEILAESHGPFIVRSTTESKVSHVLLAVGDNESRAVLKHRLSRSGHVVHACGDASELLQTIRRESDDARFDRFDGVICDIEILEDETIDLLLKL